MGRKNIDAFWDRQNLYNLNTNFDELFRIVETVRDVSLDLVNDSKLTEEQFQRLQIELNGLLKKGEVSIFDINKSLGKIDQTFLTEELIQQIAGNANVNAIPADESLTTNKYANKSVTPNKTNFIKTSNNLFNKNDVITGKNLNVNTGEVITPSVAVIFNKWFEVNPGETYTSSGTSATVFYDKDKKYVSGFSGSSKFNVPDKAKYARFTSTVPDTAQLNFGPILKPYDEYVEPTLSSEILVNGVSKDSVGTVQLKNNSVTMDKVDFINRGNNLLNKNKFLEGYSITETSKGVPVENKFFYLSDYITVEPDTYYSSDANGTSTRVAFYDENKKYISQFFENKGNPTFKTPVNAHFLRINIYVLRYEDAMLNKGQTLLEYEDWHEPILSGVKLDDNKEDNKEDIPSSDLNKSEINYFALDNHLNLEYTPPTIKGIGVNDELPAGSISYTDYYDYYDELMEKYPDYISKKLEGTDKDGNEIYRYDFKPERPEYSKDLVEMEPNFNKPKIFLVSSTHGYERTIIWALYNTMKLICEEWEENEALEFLRWNAHFIVIPIISPSGYTNATRINGNGVDLNRNFTADWGNGSANPELTTYRGPSPLSEPEAKICDNIMKNEDLTFVIDFHNFHSASKSNYFNWFIGSSPFVNALGEQLISKMSRKWKKNYPDLPQDSRFFGYVNPMIEVGSMTNQAIKKYGISSTLFETCWHLDDKPGVENRDSFVSTIATDSVINYLILILKNANKL